MENGEADGVIFFLHQQASLLERPTASCLMLTSKDSIFFRWRCQTRVKHDAESKQSPSIDPSPRNNSRIPQQSPHLLALLVGLWGLLGVQSRCEK
jgi:hypothetical protein